MERGATPRRAKQSNLGIHSDLSLSTLASGGCGLSAPGSARGNGNAAGPFPPAKSEGVTCLLPLRKVSSSQGLRRESCSSDTDQESTSGGGTEREGGHTETQSSGSRVELEVYTELLAIRDKMKEELQVLVAKEDRIQQIARDVAEREEEVNRREEEMTGQEEEMNMRELEMKGQEEEMREREKEMGIREEEMKHRELCMKEKAEEIKTMEEKMKKREDSTTKKEEQLKTREHDISVKEEGLTRNEDLLRERETELASREAEVSSREKVVSNREERVVEMEKLACEAHQSLMECIEREVEERLGEVEGGQREELGKLEREARERNKELKRLRECYTSVKRANENLKKELREVGEKSARLQAQLSLSHNRLAAMQRKTEVSQLQVEGQRQLLAEVEALKQRLTNSHPATDKRKTHHTSAADAVCGDVLGSVMGWLCRAHLSQPLSPSQQTSVQQTSCKILPSLATLLPSLSDHQLPALELVHWCLVHLSPDKKLKSSLASTLRRIGDCVYKPLMAEVKGEKAEDCFINSSNVHIRILSSLVIFQTITQVDCLAKVFEQLYQDLKEDQKARELFLLCRGADCLLPFMKASSRVLCTHTVNTHLLLSTESAGLLAQCMGSRQWLSACAALLRETSDTPTLEKMSIVLQRLSKTKGTRGVFESERVVMAVQEILRLRQADTDSTFLVLNLQSTLTNLNQNH